MRSLWAVGLVGFLTAGAAGAALAQTGSQMRVGNPDAVAPRPAPPGGWNGVPALPLHPPVQPGQWGAGGWSGVPGGASDMRGPPPPGGPGGWPRPGWSGHDGPRGGGIGHGGYVRPYRGGRLSTFFITPGYFVSDWNSYGFPAPGYGRNWVRYYDDAVLAGRDGVIYDTIYGVDWGRRGDGPGYGGYPGGYYPHPRVYHVPPGGVTTVIVQTAPSVATTTTTTYVDGGPVRVWRPSHKRVWKAKPRCNCR